MTFDNFFYRTNPLFLRNQFHADGKWKIPIIPKVHLVNEDLEDLRLIGFDKARTGNDTHYNRMVHFFLYDYEFETVWRHPDKYIEQLKPYRAVLTPDFSMYVEMNPVIQLYNTFRNRWVGAYFAEKGLKVIPTVNWGLENTFDFCFNGIEKGSTVAVSTFMVSEHGNHQDQKDFFLAGYNEMLKRLEPETIICYNDPFPEMRGNIVFVDYDLSSWRHYKDDADKSFAFMFPKSECNSPYIKQCIGFIGSTIKGSGSAFGGKWKPKKEEDQRFVGTPGGIKETYGRNGEKKWTKIGSDGYAERERHFSVHSHPNVHSNPHDHIIDWSKNYPDPSKPINYYGDIPEFKTRKGGNSMDGFAPNKDSEDHFESISDFEMSLVWGKEIEFEWKEKKYGLFSELGEKQFLLHEAGKDDMDWYFDTIDEVLDFEIDGQALRSIITEVSVLWRNI